MMAGFDSSLPKHLVLAIKEKRLSSCLLELQAWAAQGDPVARIALAHAFFYGGHGVERNFEQAKHWLERIDAEDDLRGYAAYRLGIIYYKGLSVASDHVKAFRSFRSAALRGNHKSLLMVAAMQKEGDGTLKKRRTAKMIFWTCAKDRSLSIPMRTLALLWLIPLIKRWAPTQITGSGSLLDRP